MIYKNNGRCFVNRRAEERFIERGVAIIARRLGLRNSRWTTRRAIFRFYNELWIPSGPGIRAQVESKLVPSFSPFAEARVSRDAYSIVPHLGLFGRFEAEMIRRLNPRLAAVETVHGFPMDRIGAVDQMKILGRAVVHGPLQKPYQAWKLIPGRPLQRAHSGRLLKRFPLIRELYAELPELGLSLNWGTIRLLEQSFNRAMGAMFFLKQYSSKVRW